jgi:hypothetical protein
MNFRSRPVIAFALILTSSFCLSAAPIESPSVRATDVSAGTQLISPQKLKMHLSFIASDELEGRDTPSRGLDLAARYIASHLEFYGYQPAGDNGTFYQTIAMSKRRASKNAKVTISAGDQKVEFGQGVDFFGSGGEARGELLFAGYGVASKDADYDDYAGLDANGKLVVVFDGTPEGFDANLFRPERKGGRPVRMGSPKLNLAREHGAVGVITLKNADYTTRRDNRPSPFELANANASRETLTQDYQVDDHQITVDLTSDAGAKLEDILGVKFAEIRAKIAETKKPVAVATRATFQADLKPEITQRITTQNVVGFLEGSDPKLKEEIVLFSAHYDHVGMMSAPPRNAPPDSPAAKDLIFNGADDDGSGTVGILNLAEAYAGVTRPRRSLLFVWHCGEEHGLWGSSYFVQKPAKPLDKIVANVNIDMIGRNSDDKPENSNHIFIIGARRTSQELTDIVYRTNADRMRLDETDNASYFTRSDHFNYARNRIPVVFFFTGVHKDYHKVTDEVGSILFDKMKKVLDIIFEVGLEVANRDGRPAFTGQGF